MFLVCLQMTQRSIHLQSPPNPSFLLFYESKVETRRGSFTLCGNRVICEVGLDGLPAVKVYRSRTVAWGRKVNLPLPVAKAELEAVLEFKQRARFIPAKSITGCFTNEK